LCDGPVDNINDGGIPPYWPDNQYYSMGLETMINFNAPVVINIYNNDCCNDDGGDCCDEVEPVEPEPEPELCPEEPSDDHPGVQEVLNNVQREGACRGLLVWSKDNEIGEAAILAELQNEELKITDHCDQ
jgi:hypothetical protein